ncbi:hypothetical protein Aduo_006497 [Ancylostoma duodenale]
MKVVWRQCVKEATAAVKAVFSKLGEGVKFQEVADASISFLNRFCPRCVYRPLLYIHIFILFHLYLLYAIIYAAIQFITHHSRIKGSHVIPKLPDFAVWKDKIFMFITSIFVWHWFSSSVLGVSAGWQYFSSWIVNLRPQINIKPQLKLVSSSESCPSTKSNISLALEDVDADVNIFLTPKNKELAGVMKNVEMAKRSASFASDLVSSVAGSISRSNSVDSALSWASFSDGHSAGEIDLDEELEKFSSAESLNDDNGGGKNEEKEPLISESADKSTKPPQFRLSLRDVAKEVLTKVSIASSGLRSRIPRPVDMERFNARNAAANTTLRQKFLKRNKSPGFEECRLLPDSSE